MTKWKVNEAKSGSHWIELNDAEADADDDSYEKASKENGTAACIKWDGCVHLVLSGSYLHICSVTDLIDRLVEIRDLARSKGFEGYE